jgi:hypothetical protein
MGPVETYIRQAAARYGIDPDQAVRVALSEGGQQSLTTDPFRRSVLSAPGSQAGGGTEASYGPFQLYISGRGAGLGDRAVAAGIDPRTNWQGGVDYALQEAARQGWGQWHGWKGNPWAGIKAGAGSGAPAGPVAAAGGGAGNEAGQTVSGIGPPVPSTAAPTATAATTPPDYSGMRDILAQAYAPQLKTGSQVLGDFFGAAGQAYRPAAQPALMNTAAPQGMLFQPQAQPIAQAADQRQQLAAALARLNQGSLW